MMMVIFGLVLSKSILLWIQTLLPLGFGGYPVHKECTTVQ
jgi:hypothetical protein